MADSLSLASGPSLLFRRFPTDLEWAGATISLGAKYPTIGSYLREKEVY